MQTTTPIRTTERSSNTAVTTGVDVVFHCAAVTPEDLAAELGRLAGDLILDVIRVGHSEVWPLANDVAPAVGYWTCRFVRRDGALIGQRSVTGLHDRLSASGFELVVADGELDIAS